MQASLDVIDLTAAFLAAVPSRHEPPQEPARRPFGVWRTFLIIGAMVLTTALPLVIALDAYRAEEAFRAHCTASGGRVAVTQDARQPYSCTHV